MDLRTLSLGTILTCSLAACGVPHADFLRVPVRVPEAAGPERPDTLLVQVSLPRLRQHFADFDLRRLSIYQRGRHPVPWRQQGPDLLLVQLAGSGDPTWLVFVHPSSGPQAEFGSHAETRAAALDWDAARH